MKESKTTYAYLIEHMQNPSFQKVWDIAYDFVHKLPSELCDELHESLNRGVDVLDSEPMLQMYIYAFGKMHNAKLLHAFNHLQNRVLKNDKIVIIDWGCGQGLAYLCYHDRAVFSCLIKSRIIMLMFLSRRRNYCYQQAIRHFNS